MRSVVTPLLAGNTVIVKTSEITPFTQYLWAKLLHEAGVPEGALSVIHIAPPDAPKLMEALVADKRVRWVILTNFGIPSYCLVELRYVGSHVNFTGSTRVGSIFAGLAGRYLKPTLMELGGKAAALLLPDADLEVAASHSQSAGHVHCPRADRFQSYSEAS